MGEEIKRNKILVRIDAREMSKKYWNNLIFVNSNLVISVKIDGNFSKVQKEENEIKRSELTKYNQKSYIHSPSYFLTFLPASIF